MFLNKLAILTKTQVRDSFMTQILAKSSFSFKIISYVQFVLTLHFYWTCFTRFKLLLLSSIRNWTGLTRMGYAPMWLVAEDDTTSAVYKDRLNVRRTTEVKVRLSEGCSPTSVLRYANADSGKLVNLTMGAYGWLESHCTIYTTSDLRSDDRCHLPTDDLTCLAEQRWVG